MAIITPTLTMIPPARLADVISRFWSHVDKGGDCWLWTGTCWHFGHGRFYAPNQLNFRAHRFSYELAHGPIPSGKCICHKCDVPGCVNPKHLYAGDKTTNSKDRNDRGRQVRGAEHHSAVLTAADVLSIRSEYKPGTGNVLARRYGISGSSLLKIIHRRSWKHV